MQQDLALQQDEVQQRGAVFRAQVHQQSAIVCSTNGGEQSRAMSSCREWKTKQKRQEKENQRWKEWGGWGWRTELLTRLVTCIKSVRGVKHWGSTVNKNTGEKLLWLVWVTVPTSKSYWKVKKQKINKKKCWNFKNQDKKKRGGLCLN